MHANRSRNTLGHQWSTTSIVRVMKRQKIVLVQLSKINIVSEGNNRISITSDKVYVNPAHIISVRDYEGIDSSY